MDALIAQTALRQHGLVTAAQLRAIGVSDKGRRTRLTKGILVRAEPNVYRVAACPTTWECSVLAPLLAVGPEAMASHRCAAALWGLDGFRRTCAPELAIPRRRRLQRSDVVVHRSTDLHLVEPVWHDHIPTTPVDRTLLDLCAVVSRKRVIVAIDDARRKGIVSWDKLLHTLVIHARRGRNGVAKLRRIINEHEEDVARTTDSGFERLVIVLLGEQGMPKPVLQHEVRVGPRTYRIDLAYPDERVAVELDGQVHLQIDVWERDHRRQNDLVNAGWTVLRFTWRQYRDDPMSIVRAISTALKARSNW